MNVDVTVTASAYKGKVFKFIKLSLKETLQMHVTGLSYTKPQICIAACIRIWTGIYQ